MAAYKSEGGPREEQASVPEISHHHHIWYNRIIYVTICYNTNTCRGGEDQWPVQGNRLLMKDLSASLTLYT